MTSSILPQIVAGDGAYEGVKLSYEVGVIFFISVDHSRKFLGILSEWELPHKYFRNSKSMMESSKREGI